MVEPHKHCDYCGRIIPYDRNPSMVQDYKMLYFCVKCNRELGLKDVD